MNTTGIALRRARETELQFLENALAKQDFLDLFLSINPKEFINENVARFHSLMLSMKERGLAISLTSLGNELKSREDTDFLVGYCLGCSALIEPRTLLQQFKNYHRLYRMVSHHEKLFYLADSASEDYDGAFQEALDYYTNSCITGNTVILRDLADYSIDELYGMLNPRKTVIESLDKALDAIYDGQFICIAGSPGCGKTELGLTIAHNMPDSLFISLEMDAVELYIRILSRESGVNSRKIRKKVLDAIDLDKLDKAKAKIKKKSTMQISDSVSDEFEILSLIRQKVKTENVKQVVLDYVQLVSVGEGGTQNERFERFSRKIKNLCRELKIPIIGLSQLTKSSLTEGRAPMLADIRGSLAFGQDGDVVIFVYEDEEKIPSCSIGKNRNGDTGKITDYRYIKPIHSIY